MTLKHLLTCGWTITLLMGIAACGPMAESASVSGAAENSQIADNSEVADSSKPDGSNLVAEGTAVSEVASAESASAESAPAESALVPDNPDAISQPAASGNAAKADAEACENPQTQQALNQCAYQAFEEAVVELNRAYQSLENQIASDAQQALTAAEWAWVDFRDLDCDFARQQFAGGSIVPLIYSNCLEGHTEIRTAEIRQPALPESDYATADAALNQAYQALLGVLSPANQEVMTDIQLAWIDYRDRNCAFEAQHHPTAITQTQCLARMSETRTAKIRQDTEQRSL